MIGHRLLLTVLVGVLLVGTVPSGHPASTPYAPRAGDEFVYTETIALSNGAGNYTGYTEASFINGTVGVTSVPPNGTADCSFSNTDHYTNSTGGSQQFPASGTFSFYTSNYSYDHGTDNQTGYSHPYLWFFVDNTLGVGRSLYLLNTPMSVVATNLTYQLGTTAGGYVKTTFVEGNGSYQRNDAYGVFTASYNWKAYFDPSTGYIIAYLYTESDTNPQGDGFSLTDFLRVTTTSYPLTTAPAPPPPPSGGSGGVPTTDLVVIAAVVVLVVIVVGVAWALSRRRGRLPAHSREGQVTFTPPSGPAPPPISLRPSGEPPVQQIVVKETVKVNCRYCGALIDSTVEKCPFCGAPRP